MNFKYIRRTFLTGLSLLALLTPSRGYTLDLPQIDLSLNSAILFALHNNPDIEIYLERFAQAQSNVGEQEAALYPTIDLSLEGGRGYNTPSSTNSKSDQNYFTQASITLEQILFDGFRTQHTIKQFGHLSESAYWTAQNQIETVLTETVEIYMDILEYQDKLSVNTDLLIDTQETVNYITDQYEAGAADKVILDYANSRLANATTEVNKARSSLNDAVSNLEFLTGKLPPDFRVHEPELLSPDKLDLQYYLNLTEQENSRIISSEFEIEAMEQQLAAQRGRDLPSVSLTLTADQTHNSGGESGRERGAEIGFNVSYNLFDGSKKRHVKNRMKSQINELVIRHDKILKEIRKDIKLAYNQIESTHSSLEQTEIEINASIGLKELNEENFKLGNINVIELIESAERLNAAKLKKVELNKSLYLNGYRLLLLSSMIDQNFFCASCTFDTPYKSQN